MFTPSDNTHGAPPVFVACVGPLMTENAGEVADGLLLHPFTTEEYIRIVTLPALASGLEKSGRSRSDLQVVASPFFVTEETEEEIEKVKLAARNQIAFYGSTPAYCGVLGSIGYDDLQPELNRLSKAGEWAEMGTRIADSQSGKAKTRGLPRLIKTRLTYAEL